MKLTIHLRNTTNYLHNSLEKNIKLADAKHALIIATKEKIYITSLSFQYDSITSLCLAAIMFIDGRE